MFRVRQWCCNFLYKPYKLLMLSCKVYSTRLYIPSYVCLLKELHRIATFHLSSHDKKQATLVNVKYIPSVVGHPYRLKFCPNMQATKDKTSSISVRSYKTAPKEHADERPQRPVEIVRIAQSSARRHLRMTIATCCSAARHVGRLKLR